MFVRLKQIALQSVARTALQRNVPDLHAQQRNNSSLRDNAALSASPRLSNLPAVLAALLWQASTVARRVVLLATAVKLIHWIAGQFAAEVALVLNALVFHAVLKSK
jgi:hypothetical protein